MKTTFRHSLALVALLVLANAVHAQEKGCIELKTVAESEQEYVNEQGQRTKRLVPAAKVVPGDEVVWTITAKNVCSQPAENIVIANPIPEHMSFVASSAVGVGAEITYSLDGKEFKRPDALFVSEENGATRPARADEFRAVRWAYANAFQPGAVAFVRYRAVVK